MALRPRLDELVRGGPPRPHLVVPAYHTPNGHLHLGHLGGPFLSGDAVARQLRILGHPVWQASATDAHESYVLFSALAEGRPPAAVATDYYASAQQTLAGFDMAQDVFLDFAAPAWARRYRERSRQIAGELVRRGRTEVESLRLPRSRRSGRWVIGPFALGRCPACGAAAAGTACEACGNWFHPGALRDVVPRREQEDGDLAWEDVPTVFLRAARELSADEVERRFPPGCSGLLERYLALNGPRLHLTHPLGWGVPWEAGEGNGFPPETVHVSYGLGSCAAARVMGEALQELVGAASDPFSRGSDVVTVITGGFDAVVPCMLLLAFMDDELDWQPFQHHVLNHFLLLDGRKFSTSQGHAILGRAYLGAGLDSDLFRLHAARLWSREREGDFRPAAFASDITAFATERVAPVVAVAFDALEASGPQPLSGLDADAAGAALAAQAAALDPAAADLAAAAAGVEDWIARGEAGMARSAPYWWLKTLAVLSFPLMPRWAGSLWSATAGDGVPALAGFEQLARGSRDRYVPLPGISRAQLAALAPQQAAPR